MLIVSEYVFGFSCNKHEKKELRFNVFWDYYSLSITGFRDVSLQHYKILLILGSSI